MKAKRCTSFKSGRKYTTISKSIDKEKKKDWEAYHIVDFTDLYNGTAKREDCALEINKRIDFAKKYKKGKYDKIHRRILRDLSCSFTIYDKLNLSLDALCVINKQYSK